MSWFRARVCGLVVVVALLPVGCGAASTSSSSAGDQGATGSTTSTTSTGGDLALPAEKDIAMQLVSSAENSTLDWRAQYAYLEDIDDGRGWTGGLIGFTSATGDMLQLVEDYTRAEPRNPLAVFVPALQRVDGTASHEGLGPDFEQAWAQAASDPAFRRAQDDLRDTLYFDPAVGLAKRDGLGALGQFVYYDATVVHGPGDDADSMGGIRRAARATAPTPADGGDEVAYLEAFFAARIVVMRQETAHDDVSRITDAQAVFLHEGNLGLRPPLVWTVYGDPYRIG